MKPHAAHRGRAPEVDEGDARDLVALLRRELRPTPGRLGDCARIVVVLLALVAIAETFRISEIALSGYIVLFVSGREAVTTILTALLAGIAVVLAIFVAIAVFMLSLSEPALRIPLMAAMTFVAMFLSRTATPGPVFFVAGFIVAYGLTLGDQVLGLALQPATAGNAEQFALPEIVFAPPEEALVRFLLWLSLAVALPVILLIAANLLTGRDPARLLYQALAERISRALRAIEETLTGTAAGQEAHGAAKAPRRLLAADAFTNPEYARFAFKVTLAVMICYFAMNLADWPGIHTCVITCFFVALGTVGETIHKATLRFIGCLIGAGLGLGAILLLMPDMTDLGDLLLLLAPVTLLAAWVASVREPIAYAGLQISLALYLVVLQGYGPTIDMYTARDRTIGILFGNIVIFAIFTTIWPVSVANVVRTSLAKALEQLAALVGLDARPDDEASPAARSAAEMAFGQAIEQARAVLVNDPFETSEVRRAVGRRPIDATVVEQVDRLFIPVSAILDLRTDPAGHDLPQPMHDAIRAHHQAQGAWFQQAASWTRSGEGAGEVSGSLPEPPPLSGPGDHLAAFAT